MNGVVSQPIARSRLRSTQFTKIARGGNRLIDMKDDARVFLQNPINDDRQQSSRNPFGTSDAQFTRGGISQELDFLDALLESIESNGCRA